MAALSLSQDGLCSLMALVLHGNGSAVISQSLLCKDYDLPAFPPPATICTKFPLKNFQVWLDLNIFLFKEFQVLRLA